MAVVVNEFEASVEAGGEGASAGGKGAELKPRDFRRHLRDVGTRALRVRAR